MNVPWRYIFVSFAVGLLAGSSIGLFYSHRLAHQWIKKAPEFYLRHLDKKLHLDENQKTDILKILDADRDKILAYEADVRKTARAEIRTHLTTDQQAQYDAMLAKHEAEKLKREGR